MQVRLPKLYTFFYFTFVSEIKMSLSDHFLYFYRQSVMQTWITLVFPETNNVIKQNLKF